MQPKGEVNPLDLGGHPNPLPPFTPAGEATYLANAKFVAAGAVLDAIPGVAQFSTPAFEILATRDNSCIFRVLRQLAEIWTDGRKIPADFDPNQDIPSAIGMNTFVVDSTDYNG